MLRRTVIVALVIAASCARRPPHGAVHPAATARPTVSTASTASVAAARVVEHLPSGRSYLLVAAATSRPRPLLIVLPGLYLDAARTAAQTGVETWARAHDVSVAYGVGLGGSWAAGHGCCGYALRHRVDDIAYLRALVVDVQRRVPVDPRAIGIAGDSLGGMMALRAACALPMLHLGASVGGPLLVPCGRAANLLRVRGLRDTTVPAAGGYDTYLHTRLPSLAAERRLLTHGARERIVTWPGGHGWPRAADGFDATALIGSSLLAGA